MYLQPRRLYRNLETEQESLRLIDVIGESVTINKGFSIGGKRGTWHGSPFLEVESVPSFVDWEALKPIFAPAGQILRDAPQILFDKICESIARSWQVDKFHVVFCSSGNDSRIIAGAIERLLRNRRIDTGPGLRFLSNRWEAENFWSVMIAEGWKPETYAMHNIGPDGEHFARSLEFDRHWETTNAPIPIPGNLFWYLTEWAQERRFIPDDQLQGYSGYYGNETWRVFRHRGLDQWRGRHNSWYCSNVMAALPHKIPMEYPLTDVNVLRAVQAAKGIRADELRRQVADLACPNAVDVPRLLLDDRGHVLSSRLRKYCTEQYRASWYGQKVRRRWTCPRTSEFCSEWGWYGLASLCEELRRRDVEIAT